MIYLVWQVESFSVLPGFPAPESQQVLLALAPRRSAVVNRGHVTKNYL